MATPNPAPGTPLPVTAGAIPFYKSPQEIALATTAVSALIAVFPKLGQFFHLSTPSDAANAVTAVFGFIAVVVPIIGGIVRWNSKGQPLTVTQAAADAHPATQAVVTVQAKMAEAGIPTAAVLAAQLKQDAKK